MPRLTDNPADQNINMRVRGEILASIDRHAQMLSMSRTQYIMSFLPDYHRPEVEDDPKR